LLLARDQIGIKPLFYSITRDFVVWGSEIKAILASDLVDVSLDPLGVTEFLTWEYVPGSGTLYREVRKLPPGALLVMERDGSVRGPTEYWDIPLQPESKDIGEDEWLARLADSLDFGVRRQLVSDVPLGAFLSGGVDSSLVVSAMDGASTFSIGFDDPTYNELNYSNKVARHLGSRHVTRVLEPHVADLFETLMYHMDDPIGDFSIFPTFLVSRLARESVTVCLSGDGGDELFGGYETYVAQQMAQRYEFVPSAGRKLISSLAEGLRPSAKKKGLINKIKRFVEGTGYPETLGHARWRIFLSDALRNSLFTEEFSSQLEGFEPGQHILDLSARAGACSSMTRALYVDAKSYLPDNCLVKVDRMSMAESLEVRVPFLDIDLVNLAFSIPDNLKVKGRETKYLLKKLAAKRIPNECVYRPKEGFSIPIKNWLGEQFEPILEKYTEPSLIKMGGIFDPSVISQLKKEHLTGAANHSHILWSLIVFQAWQEQWLSA
jgi:asparagine synthase (glutamine-hydrolysing)